MKPGFGGVKIGHCSKGGGALGEGGQTGAARLLKVLDAAIVVLMLAIVITLSLPVCIAVVEQKAIEQSRKTNDIPPTF